MKEYSIKYNATNGWYCDQCDRVLSGDIDRFAIPLLDTDVTFREPAEFTHRVPTVYRPVQRYGLLPLVSIGWTIALRDTETNNRKVATLEVVDIREVHIQHIHDNKSHGMGFTHREDLVKAWEAACGEQYRAWVIEFKVAS